MPSPEEPAYSAVERAYGQGDFVRALELAQALQAQLQSPRDDQLDQRLQLLIGHIHLYGLDQPRQAEVAYRAVLDGCTDANYRQLAEQGLQLLQPDELPATPWLEKLEAPQRALNPIQPTLAAPWTATVETSVAPTEITTETTPTKEPDQPTYPATQDTTPAAAATTDPDPLQLERGLLLVRLSSREHQGEPFQRSEAKGLTQAMQEPPTGEGSWQQLKARWRDALLSFSPKQRNDDGASGR